MSKPIKKQESYKLSLFQGEEIRRIFFDGDWYYSVEDVVKALTDSLNPKDYINKLRQRNSSLKQGYGQFVHTLPLPTKGGRQNVNCANSEGILRIIQEIPSKKAEPFKRWLARIGKERINEIEQPSKAIERAKGYYLAKGYSPEWIETRSAGIETRHKFTDTLKEHGIKETYHFAILTNELYSASFGLNAADYKAYKGLEKDDSLRDNMTPLELAATIFSEATSTEIISKKEAKGIVETKNAIHVAGNITQKAIEEIEKQTGKKVVTHENAKELQSQEIMNELAQSPMKEDGLKGKVKKQSNALKKNKKDS
jgi:DNA-damage-inducible protein D